MWNMEKTDKKCKCGSTFYVVTFSTRSVTKGDLWCEDCRTLIHIPKGVDKRMVEIVCLNEHCIWWQEENKCSKRNVRLGTQGVCILLLIMRIV